jgi:hypothetical protein
MPGASPVTIASPGYSRLLSAGAMQPGGSTISLTPLNVFPASSTAMQGRSDIAIEFAVLVNVFLTTVRLFVAKLRPSAPYETIL